METQDKNEFSALRIARLPYVRCISSCHKKHMCVYQHEEFTTICDACDDDKLTLAMH